MTYWLSRAARELRTQHGGDSTRIAARHGVRDATVRRFERGEHLPQGIDGMIEAYAHDTGLRPRDYWARAMALWEDAESKPRARRSRKS